MVQHSKRGAGGLRFIAAAGIMVFASLLVLSLGLKKLTVRDTGQRVTSAESGAAFNGARAYDTLKEIVALGPRPPGSREADAAISEG